VSSRLTVETASAGASAAKAGTVSTVARARAAVRYIRVFFISSSSDLNGDQSMVSSGASLSDGFGGDRPRTSRGLEIPNRGLSY
jgi:hypothetical protein